MSRTILTDTRELPFTASTVLGAARSILGRDWMIHAAYYGMSGSLRSHRGHNIHFAGIRGHEVYAVALLDDGTRRKVSATADTLTADAIGRTLAELVTGDLEEAHAKVSRTRLIAAKFACVAPDHARTRWYHGEALTTWEVPGSYAEVEHSTKITRGDYLDDTPEYAASHIVFRRLTVEQARTVLRAIRTDNRDPRRKHPVYGPLAKQMRAAAPGLRPGDTYDRHGYGLTTVSLFVDNVVDVDLHLLYTEAPVNLTVWGSMDNQLRAAAAL
ncbi:hypothetical protein [Streptomyces rimosus]|uniref:hypothetical protein n=1 Tax=Streptomyces rimosus TaxID=1927 RepID=UPI0004C16FD2|nr:hypothetical protein [Streptomyces rimosus]